MTNLIWERSSVLEYILIYVVIVVFLVFIIPRDSVDWALAYTASVISYGAVILFIYYWSIRTNYENRDMRLIFIIYFFVMMFAQVFYYYTTNDVIAIVMLVIAIALLIYLIVRGIATPFVMAMLIPLALAAYYIYLTLLSN